MTSQELYEIVRKEIDVRASLDPAFRYAQQKLDKGNGDFTNSDECSKVLSTILGEELAKHILELGVGEGRSEVCQQLLKDHFDKVSRNFERAQSTVDRGKGIDLGTVTPEFPAERAKEVGHSLDDPTVSDEKIQRRCQGAVTNVAKSMHDSFVKENARVRNDLGLKPIIERFGSMPCKWCADVAGKYRFGEQPDDIFRRHDNCNCTIIYDTQVLRGKKDENGKRTRTWEEINPKEIEENAFNPTIFTQEQARQIEQSQLSQITRLTPQQARNLSLTTGGNGGRMESENREILLQKIDDGAISITINVEKQNPHIYGTKEHGEHPEKSYFTISIDEIQKIVTERHGTGEIYIKPNGQIKEVIKIPENVAVAKDENGNSLGNAKRATIHYSKKRTHIVPTAEKEKKDET